MLIVDEPTKGLDAALRDAVVALLRGVTDAGGIVLAITHDVGVARALGGEVAVMLESRIVERGVAAEVLVAPSHPYTRRLLDAEPAAWPQQQRRQRIDGARLLRASGLRKAFSERKLFDGLDLTLARGKRVALVGGSGSGKTTLGNILLGLVRPDRGTVQRDPSLAGLAFQKLYQDPVASFPPRVMLRSAL